MEYLRNKLKNNALWQYRRLIWRITIDDLKVRYNNTALGFIWSLLNPILTMLVLYVIFFNFRHLEQNYALYLLTGIVSYRFFTQGTNTAMSSIKSKSSLISSYAIPRKIFVMTQILSSLISYFLEFIILVPMVMIFAGIFSWTSILFPLIHGLYFLLIFGLGLILASVYPYFRDLKEIWGVVTHLGFFACPILYPITIIPKSVLPYYMLNPLAHIITIYRQLIILGEMPELSGIVYVIVVSLCLIVLGTFVFNRLEKRFVEVI